MSCLLISLTFTSIPILLTIQLASATLSNDHTTTSSILNKTIIIPSAPPPFQTWTPPTNPPQLNTTSPCPILNALKAHNIIPGTSIQKPVLKNALSELYCDFVIQNLFVDGAMKMGHKDEGGVDVVDLYELSTHNGIEHDASLTRSDDALGDRVLLNMTLYLPAMNLYNPNWRDVWGDGNGGGIGIKLFPDDAAAIAN
ncbi:hypothetical protein HDU76_004965 [Blyttiomyces sp. JEL0837]|nr:hypothetical protein HDU76_004965 [Blyttiomyces sp. JEL0837]